MTEDEAVRGLAVVSRENSFKREHMTSKYWSPDENSLHSTWERIFLIVRGKRC